MRARQRTRGGRALCKLRVLVGCLALASSGSASADSRLAFLADRVSYPPPAGQPDDFRVRTNAALALGATNEEGAVPPLCGALGDPSEVVRQAVAVALRRLARTSSLDCLRRRAAVESNAAVKLQIQRALEAIQATSPPGSSDASAPAAYVANAKFYVSIPRVSNGTSRSANDIDRVVHEAIASKLAELGGYQIAPATETNDAAKAAIAKRKLKGYYLAANVEKFDYSDGGLRVKIKIAVFSYPGRDLRGEIPAGATLPGARPGDSGAEDQLMSAVAARAAELFAQNFK
ncbi:MAG TPA: HEAT repeat domain-containing protein [Polyangiaceae bacterium]|nr:HEAT repeat domain-containing protein [Polyangiaceae bacterium]